MGAADQHPGAMRTSDKPLTKRERERKLYALTGFVRVVRLQGDCDFHVQVAQSRATAPQVLVEKRQQHVSAVDTGRLLAPVHRP